MSNKKAVIYWIHLPEQTDFMSQGYIGVSIRHDDRILEHFKKLSNNTHKNPHLSYAFKKHGWDRFIKDILLYGSEEYCYLIENKLRPTKGIGWNITIGGHRGPGWPKGKQRSAETLAKMAIARKNRSEKIKKLKEELKLKTKAEREAKKNQKKQELLTAKLLRKEKRHQETLRRRREKLLKQNTFKSSINSDESNNPIRPICPSCNNRKVAVNFHKHDKIYYRNMCDSCIKLGIKLPVKHIKPDIVPVGYKKKPVCERCGFKSKMPQQILVHYIDGNKLNTSPLNLKSICLNCDAEMQKSGACWNQGDLIPDY